MTGRKPSTIRNRATRKRVQEARNNIKKFSEETKVAGQGEGKGPTVCLFANHFHFDLDKGVNSSMYVIRLPDNLSEHDEDQMIEVSESAVNQNTILTFYGMDQFMHFPAFVNIGSKIYIFGGQPVCDEEKTLAFEAENRSRRVQVIDINDPKPELKSVAPMHTPKNSPCVFVADGMIYAIAPNLFSCNTKLPGSEYTGLFERYIPSTDSWQVLPDPPSFKLWAGAELLDCATVIGTRVIIGCPAFRAIFDLEKLVWDETLGDKPDRDFPFGSVFASQTGSLYHLSGFGVPRLLNGQFARSPYRCDPNAVSKFPFTAPIENLANSGLVNDPATKYCQKQIIADDTLLDSGIPFAHNYYFPRRYFFHVGGSFFCYIVTAQLIDNSDFTQFEPDCRGVFIKFFKEDVDNNSNPVFKAVASFCYKFTTEFPNMACGTRCTVIGTVPDSWTKSQPKKKQGGKLKSVNSDMTSEGEKSEVGETIHPEVEKAAGNDQPDETRDWEKLLAARDAEISILKAELAAAKEKLLRTDGASETGQ